jgi:hypothetical protein
MAGGWPRSNRRLAAAYYHTAGHFQHAPQASSKKGPYQVLPQVTCLEDLAKARGYGIAFVLASMSTIKVLTSPSPRPSCIAALG